MENKRISVKKQAAANQNIKERDFWLDKLSGEPVKSSFPYDYVKTGRDETFADHRNHAAVPWDLRNEVFQFPGELSTQLMKLSKGKDHTLHMILVSGLVLLLAKYTYSFSGHDDIMVGTPIYKQDIDNLDENTGLEFINTILPLRICLKSDMTFKELLLEVKETIINATEHYNYPIEILLEQLNLPVSEGDAFPLFDVALLLENIHDRSYIQHIVLNTIFSFSSTADGIEGVLEYHSSRYQKATIERMTGHLIRLLENALANLDLELSRIEILPEKEKEKLLQMFNDTEAEYPNEKTIHELFEEQAARTPSHIALRSTHTINVNINTNVDTDTDRSITYKELNSKSNQLARWLRKHGVTTESVVGVMMERSIDTVICLMAILKAGGAYLPIDIGLPQERVLYMLENADTKVLLSNTRALREMEFTALQGFEENRDNEIVFTGPRMPIKAFNTLSMPDRSLIDLRNYKNKIGMASVTDCMSIQTTRGCPFECLYCHKVWSKLHVHRSAENIFNEVEYYYKKGITNFAFIDDCFNLNRENSSRLFQLIIQNRLKVQLFFPNGLRGDIMTPDYIDRMVEAGTRGINLSLETASPRLQKLLKKNLDLDKFKSVVDYIATQHPHVILEMASMHGFPTETEEEAMMTLNFIKEIKWLHFPYIHILKIFPNTEMEEFALAHGVSKEDIMISKDRAFHELPETLPFPKSFTRKYQANFMNEYFLDKERLKHVLPVQMQILSEDALAQKYNAYLPVEIKGVKDVIQFAQLGDLFLPDFKEGENRSSHNIFDQAPPARETPPAARKILLLDLSQHFSSHRMLYRVVEQPLGLIYLLTYLKERFGDKIDGRIYKSGNDFDNFEELKQRVEAYHPDLIGIRTLTFFKEFFHEVTALLRQWGIEAPIIAGGPYASSDYDTILKDPNVDLAVLGEGEYTFGELLEKMLDKTSDFKIPGPDTVKAIKGIAYKNVNPSPPEDLSRQVVRLDQLPLNSVVPLEEAENLIPHSSRENLAYVMYTSGSTGKPKGVMVEHRQVNNCIHWMQEIFNLTESDMVVQRTNLSFDPSVWEIFWPLYQGGSVKILDQHQSKDAQYLIQLMADNGDSEAGDLPITMMYCPATLVSALTYLLNNKAVKPRLKLPWLLIGAEPISMEVVKDFYTYFDGKIVNTYGPTECTINNTYYDLAPDDERAIVPIGKPVANNKIYIVARDLHPLPIRIPGEICIAGESVARGYINNRERTDLSFVKNPFGKGKLYKTGDIGRWLEDGTIEIMGRVDEQVKIRGYRIELGEIESTLTFHPAVKEALVMVRDRNADRANVTVCKTCGITSHYPGITISNEGLCGFCENINSFKTHINNYFKTMQELESIIKEANKEKKSPYDCLLLYAGGRGTAYALYQLKEMGFKVLTLTYNNGYFSKTDLKNIKEITSKLGVDHEVVTHPYTDQILKESIKAASTVCRGCFHISSSLAAEYAYTHDIKVVIGATLSRGQIIENRLLMFLQRGITDVQELEHEIKEMQKITPQIDKPIFDLIDIDVVTDGQVHDKVKFLDFYRYCDISNKEMIAYLDNRDPYWKTRKYYAIYSTNCPIKQIGDYGHLQLQGFHYYGAATSWEKRLDHLTMENVKEDLQCNVTAKGYENFLKRIGYPQDKSLESSDKYLCAYVVPDKSKADKELSASDVKEYLLKRLPQYMIPSHVEQLEEIPLTSNGKVDRNALSAPTLSRVPLAATYVEPKTNLEQLIAETWQSVLKVDRVGTQDNFFDLGGNSLDIVMVGGKLKEALGREIPAVTLFTYPTISSLGSYLTQEQGEEGLQENLPDRSHLIDGGKDFMHQTLKKLEIGD